MGFVKNPDPYSHRSTYTLFTPEECNRLSKILLRDERMVLDIPNIDDNTYEGVTHQFSVYNWLNNPDLLEFDIPKRLFTLPEFQDESILYVQCWVNILRQGKNIPYHVHGDETTDINNNFYASNTFISGPQDTGTHYNDTYERNEQGTMNLIGSMIPHEVKTHMSNTPRISMAMDIYHETHGCIKEAIIDSSTTFISPQSVKNRFKRITNRFNSK
tara:strand:- start:2206 stop:2850 length:645 start_codon:yes stop_codon:yes gene_type:complete